MTLDAQPRGGASALALLCVLALAAESCVLHPRDPNEQDAGASTHDDESDAGTKTFKGIQCGKDPTTGVTLCAGTTACPDQVLDSAALPGCGYRTVTPSFDLECVCNGTHLCPIGVARTCAEITDALEHRTLNDICNQVGSGACRELDAPMGAGGAGGSSSCDRTCKSECAGEPSCMQLCGC